MQIPTTKLNQLTVDILTDEADGSITDGDISLRDALGAIADGGTITFASNLSGQTIVLNGSEIEIAKAVTIEGDIDGNGSGDITLNGERNSRVLNIDDNNGTLDLDVFLSGLTIGGGSVSNENGGGILNHENLTLTGSTVIGNGAVNGGGLSNQDGTVTLTGSTVSGNVAQDGAGIQNNSGTLNVSNSTISDNQARSNGGGIDNALGNVNVSNSTISGNTGGFFAGGIYNASGSVNVSNSTISGNSSLLDGGGINNAAKGTLNLNSTLVGDNIGGTLADINDTGTITVTNSLLEVGNGKITDGTDGNIVGQDPLLDPAGLKDNGGPTQTIALQPGSPAINTGDDNGLTTDQRGTGFKRIENGRADIGALEFVNPPLNELKVDTLTDETDGSIIDGDISLRDALGAIADGGTITFASNLSGQTIALNGSEIEIAKAVTIEGDIDGNGSGDITLDGGDKSRVLNIDDNNGTPDLDVFLSGLTISRGLTSDDGGGILNDENLTLTGSTLSGNSAINGGGLGNKSNGTVTLTGSTVSGNVAQDGAGIQNNSGTLNVSNSTISDNQARSNGGGIDNALGNVNVSNSTISGNTGGFFAGGIYNASGSVNVSNSTISGNSSLLDGGGINNAAKGTLNLNSTLVGDNIGGTLADINDTGTITVTNSLLEVGNGKITDGTDGNIVGQDPLLDPAGLKDNGGPTQTIALQPGSPAINTGDDNGLTTDQRGTGFKRIENGRADIGAFEELDTQIPDAPKITSSLLTNLPNPTITGTAEPGSTINLKVTNNSSEAVYLIKATARGNWQVDTASASPTLGSSLFPLSDGSSATLSAKAIDPSGQESQTATQVLAVDLTPPNPPTLDRTILNPTLNPLTGKAEADAKVLVQIDTDNNGQPDATLTTTADGNGVWSVDLNQSSLALKSGKVQVRVLATDAAGNTSHPTPTELTIDTVAPPEPVFTSPDATNSLNPIISGTAEPGSTVQIDIDGNGDGNTDASYQTTATNSGNFTLDLSTAKLITGSAPNFVNGTAAKITAFATDVAGNQGKNNTQTLTLDTGAPAKPSIDSAGVTNTLTPTITGKAEANSTVKVVVESNGKSGTYEKTADGSGNWQVDLSQQPTSGDKPILEDGKTATITVTDSDKVGNISNPATQALKVDTTAPSASITSADRTNKLAPIIEGSTEKDATLEVEITVNGTKYIYQPQVDPGGNWTLDLGTAQPVTGTLPTLTDQAVLNISAIATDEAGNPSNPATQTLEIDTTGPSVPTLDLSGITNTTTPIISGIHDASSDITVEIDREGDGNIDATYQVKTDGSNNFQVDLATETDITGNTISLVDGQTAIIKAFATDQLGNPSATTTKNIKIDATPPNPPSFNSPDVTNTISPELSGLAENNSTVRVTVNGNIVYEVQTDGAGNWNFKLGQEQPKSGNLPALGNGSILNLEAIAIDAANNSSTKTLQQLTVDTGTIVAPKLSSKDVTNNLTPIIKGTDEPGTLIEVGIDVDRNGKADVTYNTTTDPDGNWQVDTTQTPDTGSQLTLTNGQNVQIIATAIDPISNTSASTRQNLLIDTVAPNAPQFTSSDVSSSLTPVMSGLAEPESIVEVDVDGQATYETKTDSAGHWTIDLATATTKTGTIPTLIDGDKIKLEAKATDEAGNISQIQEQQLIIDLFAPIATADNYTLMRFPGQSTFLDVLSNDRDPDGEALTLVSVTQPNPSAGTVIIDNNRIRFTPSTDQPFSLDQENVNNSFSEGGGLFMLSGGSPEIETTFTYTVADPEGKTRHSVVTLDELSTETHLKFTLQNSTTDLVNEIGIFKVENSNGTIDGVDPNEDGYLQSVLNNGTVVFSVLSDFSTLFGQSPTRILDDFSSTGSFGFFFIQNGTVDNALAELSAGESPTNVYLSTANINGDDFNRLQVEQLDNGSFQLNFEDSTEGIDQDFDDLNMIMELTTESETIGALTQGEPTEEFIDLEQLKGSFQVKVSVTGESHFDNLGGLYPVIDAEKGTVQDPITGNFIEPGDEGYIDAVQALSVGSFDEFASGFQMELEGGEVYVPYILADGNTDEVYVPYLAANADGLDHIRLLADNTFGFEDKISSDSDFDYNDIIFQINFE
ncbi:Ig-like domain-containing protein [Pleurocapsa sp. PCC 7319]|uniref:Ig-like domain-containing protein n=1 Tax=Pleurocapsa sp. PCC 7319 TaxID=118161 RepID=UPI0003478C0C|nr:Ig-like domain-containing protein [Pleurocapsa sp. PCC 7319]